MENAVLTKGRYKNKTYADVLEKDPDFCKNILEAAEKKQYYPADEGFADYLISKFRRVSVSDSACHEIREPGPSHFLKALTPAMLAEFRSLVGNLPVEEKNVHPACELGYTNGFLGVFYRYFIKKCVFNKCKQDGYNTYIDNYATIFPFKVSLEKADLHKVHILEMLYADDKFRNKITEFLERHFDEIKFEEIVDSFLSNIDRFRRETNMDVKQLEMNIARNENTRPHDGSGDRFVNFRSRGKQNQNPYLKQFPRLNGEGAKRFENIYACYEHLVKGQFRRVASTSYRANYFLNLPETNFYELFSLLDAAFFRDNFNAYLERFQKYLFFFVGASKSDCKPVFFIDDVLFECLKSLQTFKKSRADATELIHELKMMTLIHRRKQDCDRLLTSMSKGYDEIDPKHLEYVKKYVEDFPGIERAKVEYEIPHQNLLECKALLCVDDTTIDVRFSRIRKGAFRGFDESLLMAGLCDYPLIKRLVLYNAYTGIEYSVCLPDTFDRAAIKAFIRKYNNWDFSVQLPFEKSLTWGWENYFVEGTINWEEKKKTSG